MCLASKALARLWCQADVPESRLADATWNFIRAAGEACQGGHPPWLETAVQRLSEGAVGSARDIAAELRLHPRWVAQAYRSAVGECVRETARRTRVERAATLLRITDIPPAEIAVMGGFCDQSHMIRCFLEVLGRTPQTVRAEWSRGDVISSECPGAASQPNQTSAECPLPDISGLGLPSTQSRHWACAAVGVLR